MGSRIRKWFRLVGFSVSTALAIIVGGSHRVPATDVPCPNRKICSWFGYCGTPALSCVPGTGTIVISMTPCTYNSRMYVEAREKQSCSGHGGPTVPGCFTEAAPCEIWEYYYDNNCEFPIGQQSAGALTTVCMNC